MNEIGRIPIPTHCLELVNEPILVRGIDHKNHYDFTKLHRHSYFEVMFFVQGGGKNLIDFFEYEVKSSACYLICPGQVHLLSRAPGSHGAVIQFKLNAIDSQKLQRLMQEKAWSGKGAMIFEEDDFSMGKCMKLVDLIGSHAQSTGKFGQDSQQHLLQALLFELFSLANATTTVTPMDADFYRYLHLIDKHFREVQNVRFYIDQLAIPEKRLSALAKKYRGHSPLQIIHERVVLEAKRLLASGIQSHKEIAYDLGFDSPASFSAFVKKKTGLSPTEIQIQLTEIPK